MNDLWPRFRGSGFGRERDWEREVPPLRSGECLRGRSFSGSGGGVGGNMVLFRGGSDCCRDLRFGRTRFEAAKEMLLAGRSSLSFAQLSMDACRRCCVSVEAWATSLALPR